MKRYELLKMRQRWRKIVGRCFALPLVCLVAPVICLIGLIDYLCGGIYEADWKTKQIDWPPGSARDVANATLIDAGLALSAAIDRGGYDVSPCQACGEPVVCIPDGLAMCRLCAEKAGGYRDARNRSR